MTDQLTNVLTDIAGSLRRLAAVQGAVDYGDMTRQIAEIEPGTAFEIENGQVLLTNGNEVLPEGRYVPSSDGYRVELDEKDGWEPLGEPGKWQTIRNALEQKGGTLAVVKAYNVPNGAAWAPELIAAT